MKKNVLILFIITSFLSVYSQKNDIKFEHFSIEHGLSDRFIRAICQDKQGFLWIGTSNGLNRFNGYNFYVYKNLPGDSLSLCTNDVVGLLADRKNNLWIGCGGGLNLFDREKNTFRRFKHKKSDSKSISNNYISSIFEDRNGNLWIGTWDGLNLYNPESKDFTFFPFDTPESKSIWNYNVISTIAEDKDGILWLGTWGSGIHSFNPATKEFCHYDHDPKINKCQINKIFIDKNDKIWVATWGSGLNLFDRKTKLYQKKVFAPEYSTRSQFDQINDIFEDSKGNFWIGFEEGVIIFDEKMRLYSWHSKDDANPNSLSYKTITHIFEDSHKGLWFGTPEGGLNYYNLNACRFEHYKFEKNNANSLPDNFVRNISQDSEGNIWLSIFKDIDKKILRKDNQFFITTGGGGRAAVFGNKIFKSYDNGFSYSDIENFTKTNHFIKFNSIVRDVISDKKGCLWIASGNEGLLYYNPAFHSFINFRVNPERLLIDGENQLWIICLDKLSKVNFHDATLFADKNNYSGNLDTSKYSLQNFNFEGGINFMMLDQNKNLCLGLKIGFVIFNAKKNIFVTYTTKDGLSNNNVVGILEDSKRNLWISTDFGLSCFSPPANPFVKDGDKEHFRNYYESDGLQGNKFNNGSCYRSLNGEMFFGGQNGLTAFHPDSIKVNDFIPPVVITGFKLFNKEVPVYSGKKADSVALRNEYFLNSEITQTKEIRLNYDQNIFTLEFASLNFLNPQKNKYAYKLEGFEKEWTFCGTKREVSYTNLDPGIYSFRVKASNNDGIWNEIGATVKITITPPFWKTWWFRTMIVLLIIGSTIAYYRYKTYEIKKKNQELERRVAERTNEVMQQKEELQQQAEELEATNEELTAQSDALKKSNEELNQKNEEVNIQKEEIEKSFKISQVISEFGQRVTSTFDLESINEIVYGYICSIMPTDAFGIGLFKEEKNEIEYIGFIEEGQKIENFTKRLDSENSLTAWCFNNQKLVFINDLETDYSKYISALPKVSTNKQPHSIIHLPLSVNEKKLGIIVVNSFKKESYTSKDLIHLQSLASYITIALDNANAYKTVNAQKEKLLELDNFKEAMTGMIVHDLKNPLNAIIGLSSMNPEDEMMQMVNSAGNQMLNLVLNILDVQKFENTNVKLNLSDASLYELADEANRQVSLLIKQKKQVLNINILPQTIISTDSEVTIRVFVNMLTNAIKYTPNGGIISINQEAILSNEDNYKESELIPVSIKAKFKYQAPLCLISVSDTGQGIPADKLHLVFEKFGQVEAKKSGGVRSTGLGMTFCKMVVEAHGGEIWITSEVGKGTNFYFMLPFARNDQSIQNEKLETTSAKVEEITNKLYDIYLVHENGSSEIIAERDVATLENELKILVADDDKYSIDVMKNCLSSWGKTFLMFAVGNGKDAVDAAKIILPDIILLDWEMPHLDGLEALKQIKTIPELLKIPVAMVTSRSGNSHIQLAFDAGASDYIKKPIDKIEALFRVQTLANLSELIKIKTPAHSISTSKKPLGLVLIVDDVFEIRQMIKQILQDNYLTIEAENGKDGILKVNELQPDIIITDLNMPEMDGLQFCREVKTNIATNHIPIVMLTAQDNVPSNIAGINAGADVYLTKPISPELIIATVKNQIENREKLRIAFSRIISSEPGTYNTQSADEIFIAQCIKIVEENIENKDFHINSMVKAMAMSYGQLYGKIKYYTNLSIAGFIRSIRLKRAKQIIETEKTLLKELIIKVGFENILSFKRAFKREYGMTPKECAKKYHSKNPKTKI